MGPRGALGCVRWIGFAGPRRAWCLVFWLLWGTCRGDDRPPQQLVHAGMCDASAAVALDGNRFIAANDENNALHVYRRDQGGPALQRIPCDAFLGINPAADPHPEADIEGATVLGGRMYWIASHGRNRDGKWRPNRHRLFATTVAAKDDAVTVEPFGKPYKDLARDLVRDTRVRALGLADALGPAHRTVEDLAPRRAGLNIEGLAAMPDGRSLLIGFRNPLVRGRALLVPLHNPASVLEEGAEPRFGSPILLRLRTAAKGRLLPLGVRSIEYAPQHKCYLILAGPTGTREAFALFRWSGDPKDEPALLGGGTKTICDLEEFAPEALIVHPDTKQVQLLSDDGSRMIRVRAPSECKKGTFRRGFCQAKHLRDRHRRTFRSVWVDVR